MESSEQEKDKQNSAKAQHRNTMVADGKLRFVCNFEKRDFAPFVKEVLSFQLREDLTFWLRQNQCRLGLLKTGKCKTPESPIFD